MHFNTFKAHVDLERPLLANGHTALWLPQMYALTFRWLTLQHGGVNAIVGGPADCRICVEKVGHEGHVQLLVPGHDVLRGDELPAVEPRCLPQHELRPLLVIRLLETTFQDPVNVCRFKQMVSALALGWGGSHR